MTTFEHWNRDQLLEHAVLDAHGMLDEVEAARFSHGFAQATPQVQAEIVHIQEAAALDPAFVSDESPVRSLRLRTIARVMHAAEEAARPATIARIGREVQRHAHVDAQGDAQGHAQLGETRTLAEELESFRADAQAARRAQIAPVPLHLWRAAALFFAAGLAVTLWFNARQTDVIHVLADAARTGQFNEEVAKLGLGLGGYDFSGSTPVLLSATDAAPRASGTLHLNAQSSTIVVLAFGLQDQSSITLRATDEAGNSHNLGTCVVRDGACAAQIAMVATEEFGQVLELVSPKGEVLMRVRQS